MDADQSPTARMRRILVDANAALVSTDRDSVGGISSSTRAADWIARLMPVWRELVAQNPEFMDGSVVSRPIRIRPDAALKLIDGFLNVLAAGVPQVAKDHERLAAIEKAKQEWECTADALTSMVCLLTADGTVLRANRVVEKWGLGSVGDAVGKTGHELLHPECHDADCEVSRGLREAIPKLARGTLQEFESYSPAGRQVLHFVLRPMHSVAPDSEATRDSRSVLVVTDVSALRHAQQTLENLNSNLEWRVRSRTRELNDSNQGLRQEIARRLRAESELLASRNNLALLSEQLIQAQESERRRIALELHDSVGQSLSAIKYTIERAIIMTQRPELGNPADVLALAVQRIHETADGIRAISMNLRPQMLDDLGAASAASWFCRGFAQVYPDIALRTEVTAANTDIPDRIATHVYRALQELLNNAAKHARATTVWVILERVDSDLVLEVRDDGVGVSSNHRDAGSLHGAGLRNLRERAGMTKGRFSLESAPGGGTVVRLVWELDAEEAFFLEDQP